ncbi:hypothetical protein [Gabonibacter chumensis]|uniref:hypothetical protein n=1 Tax=Gabonibacter chumensis TaxID=2972474 RepID=UPI0025728D14|nr:hypothetical protein [Gabonibacter chumensis]MCR9011532.1 hypothetical protein [Gabonibacter chumensis]
MKTTLITRNGRRTPKNSPRKDWPLPIGRVERTSRVSAFFRFLWISQVIKTMITG